MLSAVKHEPHLFYKEVQDTEYKSAIRFLQNRIQIHRLGVFVMDFTVVAWGSVNSPCRAYSTTAVMASVAQATCSALQRSAQQPASILWRLPIGRLKGLHGAFLSSAEHRWGSSRQGSCLMVLPLPPAKHQLRSVVLSARAGEGRSVLGRCWAGAARDVWAPAEWGDGSRRGWRKGPCLHTQDPTLQLQILADSLARRHDSSSFVVL